MLIVIFCASLAVMFVTSFQRTITALTLIVILALSAYSSFNGYLPSLAYTKEYEKLNEFREDRAKQPSTIPLPSLQQEGITARENYSDRLLQEDANRTNDITTVLLGNPLQVQMEQRKQTYQKSVLDNITKLNL